ncbi:type II secretion system protein [Crenobacter cavernae]|uniref:Type II secretion system protein n=1 Tax=Crenobacter cavernae TaxID=2290923 RepID=A0ABY0FB68_9NEIS|nr:type II secretion system protein [Crenobacter cavernae]RXZ43207.1 type II secretion system protein [Crenobacter cavernae]
MRLARGFTLIELMMALTLLALLASAAFPLVELNARRNREAELRSALRQIRTAIDAYKRASDEGRIARSPEASGYPAELALLAKGVTDQTDLKGRKLYFLRRVPADPMCECPGTPPEATWQLRSYASPPDSPSAGADVFDVMSRSRRDGLNGVPYKDW